MGGSIGDILRNGTLIQAPSQQQHSFALENINIHRMTMITITLGSSLNTAPMQPHYYIAQYHKVTSTPCTPYSLFLGLEWRAERSRVTSSASVRRLGTDAPPSTTPSPPTCLGDRIALPTWPKRGPQKWSRSCQLPLPSWNPYSHGTIRTSTVFPCKHGVSIILPCYGCV